jgi:hypothetical protein
VSKDILVDNSIAKNFCNPLDPHYKRFIEWLFTEGELVVTQRLIVEYHGSTAASASATNIVAIIGKLLSDGRLRKVTKQELTTFRISNRVAKKLRSNENDWDYVKAVMLSVRKFALSLDNNFVTDVNTFPGYTARAEYRPQDLPYDS